MRNLIEFLIKHSNWLLFILLEALCLVLIFRFNGYQSSVWFSTANVVAGKTYEISSSIQQYLSLTEVNQQLTERNIYLEQQVVELTKQLQSQSEKAATDEVKQRIDALKGYNLIAAKVVNNTLNRVDNFITIDKGTSDGIEKDMGVVSGTGVVGIVYLVSEHYSVIIPVLNSHSNISCTINNRGYFGYLHWYGGLPNVAYVDDIPRHARFNNSDIIVTSGYSAVFPQGVEVGRIKSVHNSEDGISYRLKIKLSTDFGNLRDVYVVDNKAMKERQQLINAANDSIKVKN